MDKPTSRQQVLEATDAQLNKWAATVVMGWSLDRSVIGPWHPTGDIAQAMRLLKELGDDWSWSIDKIYGHLSTVVILRRWAPLDGYNQDVSHAAVGIPKAITQACILAKLGL